MTQYGKKVMLKSQKNQIRAFGPAKAKLPLP